MRVVLEVTKGSVTGERFVFEQHETWIVGRSRRAHFQILSDPHFSRHHFMIEVNPPQCFLRDLTSLNGTSVNGKKVTQAHLKDGDLVHGGKTEFRVHVEEAAPATPSRVPTERETQPLPMRPAGADVLSMDTTLSVKAPGQGEAGELRCAICGKLAGETHLSDLMDTRMVTYVCPDCREKGRDAKHPIPNYEVLGELGRGSLGPVFKARRVSSDKLVALKPIPREFSRNADAAKLFLREMHLSARLDHPNIVSVVEMGDAGGDLWIASEFIDGVDAARLARQLGGTVPARDAVDITCQVLDALAYAHGLNLVHRDVKPPNILVTGSPGAYGAKLADFGLMKNVDEAGMSGITREGEARGTVPFMPPEQVMDCRFVKSAGDIYQAGATLYWLLTGEYVYNFERRDRRGERVDPFLIILEDPIVPIRQRDPSVPEPVATAIERALEREPEDRFETAVEMAAALRTALP